MSPTQEFIPAYGAALRELLQARSDIDRALQDRLGQQVTVLVVDLPGIAAYAERAGNAESRAVVQRMRDLLCPVVDALGGRVVKAHAEALLVCFDLPRQAAEAAIRMQLKLAEHNERVAQEDLRLHARVGVSADAADLFGDPISVAARMQTLAHPGQILVTRGVRAALEAANLGLGFMPRGSLALLGKPDPLELYELDWRRVTPLSNPGPDRPRVDERYQLLEMLGSGGMASVWRATDERLGRQVAIKVLHRHLDLTPLARERFRREARTSAQLVHENVVQVFDFAGDGAAESFIAMELVEGQSLRRYLTGKGPLPDVVAVAIAHEVARALAHAHARGVVHRDVKPDNVLLSAQGAVKLGDFGIAGVVEALRLTASGAVVGSPAYMAPEQLEGDAPSPSNDVFGLGVMLYEMSTGRPPFDGQNPGLVLQQVAECKFEHPTAYAPVGQALCDIILRAMAKDPAERFADGAALAHALRQLLDARGLGDPRTALARFLSVASPLELRQLASSFEVGATAPGGVELNRALPSRARPTPVPLPPAAPSRASPRGLALGGALLAAAGLWCGLRLGRHTSSAVDAPVAPAGPPQAQPRLDGPAAAPGPSPTAPVSAPARQVGRSEVPRPTRREARASSAPSRTEPPAPGGISIGVVPWGNVTVDGQSLGPGRPAVRVIPLPPGQHTVQVTHPTLRERALQLYVPPGQTINVHVDLNAP